MNAVMKPGRDQAYSNLNPQQNIAIAYINEYMNI